MYKLIIGIGENNISLILKDQNNILETMICGGQANSSENLLLGIDEILRKNKLKIESNVKIVVESEVSDRFSAVRIAKIVAKTLNKCKTVD